MKKWKEMMKKLIYYANGAIISLGTAWFGYHLLLSNTNVIDRIDLFPPEMDVLVGWFMIINALLKVLLIFHPERKPKKYAMILISVTWLAITWAYYQNLIPNNGYVMSFMITALCYVELWRGDYAG